jgi:hypothetical protein
LQRQVLSLFNQQHRLSRFGAERPRNCATGA